MVQLIIVRSEESQKKKYRNPFENTWTFVTVGVISDPIWSIKMTLLSQHIVAVFTQQRIDLVFKPHTEI